MFASHHAPSGTSRPPGAAAAFECRYQAGSADWIGGPGLALVAGFEGITRIRTAEGQWSLAAGLVQAVEGPLVVFADRGDRPAWGVVAGTAAEWGTALGELGIPAARRFVPPGEYRLEPVQLDRLRALCLLAGRVSTHRALGILDDFGRWHRTVLEQIDRCPGRSLGQRRRVHARLQRARNLLRARCTQGYPTRHAASVVGYTVGHFQRIFHRVFGETVQGFVLRQRLEVARHLLETSQLSVGDVGLAAGFESRWAFARQFRHRFGATAGAFRRNALACADATAQRPPPGSAPAAPRTAARVPNVSRYPDDARLPAA